MNSKFISLLLTSIVLLLLASSCKKDTDEKQAATLSVTYVYVGDTELSISGTNRSVPLDEVIQIRFDAAVNQESARENIMLYDVDKQLVQLTFSFFNDNKLIKIAHPSLSEGGNYQLVLKQELRGENNEVFEEKSYEFTTLIQPLLVETIKFDGIEVEPVTRIMDIDREAELQIRFNVDVKASDVQDYSSLRLYGNSEDFIIAQVDNQTISISANQTYAGWSNYLFSISSDIENKVGRPFDGLELNYYTELDSTLKFSEISDEALLTKIQEQTFKYFWDFGHPVSGMARERNTSGETVTSGGSGFGVMAIIVGIERGFITRQQGVERLTTIVDFLAEADRFHGAWSHWLNGTTGQAKPFSTKDNGGDLVETSFMAAGLLAARQYLDASNTDEIILIEKINNLWEGIEWDWYTQGGQNVLYWHWSPDYNWEMNMKIQGYNEALITYIMAASSPSHSIPADVYHQGWAKNGAIVNGSEYYGIELPVGYSYGGPLFFAHYTFLGINPENLSDTYADYWKQNRNHSLINQAHCIKNQNHFVGYSADCWGLTASDNHQGYSAHSPTNDLGVVTPTAAISSLPYTPEESMKAIRFFYYMLGDRLWGEYGFYDAFNATEDWTADSYIAIDQGPIIIMIENYRTGLIWDLLMSCPEVQAGLTKLGFTYE
ncbi:hypothetical protein J1N10_07740 [Carboxylicivirga sp. A043]|uniref:glucoamylase family protein n=1 Tax=Carboxylicivirga litoralis TaxID=2816963 RepID=UPI0021CB56F8|nr:glucoamylase family protein [Carboxylicivirga sp. A043]MCU4155866.1 hypothetical protein [Carboxylicivirga sp. A043]